MKKKPDGRVIRVLVEAVHLRRHASASVETIRKQIMKRWIPSGGLDMPRHELAGLLDHPSLEVV